MKDAIRLFIRASLISLAMVIMFSFFFPEGGIKDAYQSTVELIGWAFGLVDIVLIIIHNRLEAQEDAS